jgi:hypothetical protein
VSRQALATVAELQLAELRVDAFRHAPAAPAFDGVLEDAGRQRLATYYLYCALIAGVIGDDGLAPARWPPEFAEPMERLGLRRFAPRTERGLDAELTPAEQAVRRSSGREYEFAQLVVDLINEGTFGPVCGDADSVQLVEASDRRGFDLALVAGGSIVGKCRAEDHWELVAQQLASASQGDDPLADRATGHAVAAKVTRQAKESGISHAVSLSTELAVGVYPLGTAAGIGTRLVRSRIEMGREEADGLRRRGCPDRRGTLAAVAPLIDSYTVATSRVSV